MQERDYRKEMIPEKLRAPAHGNATVRASRPPCFTERDLRAEGAGGYPVPGDAHVDCGHIYRATEITKF